MKDGIEEQSILQQSIIENNANGKTDSRKARFPKVQCTSDVIRKVDADQSSLPWSKRERFRCGTNERHIRGGLATREISG